MKETSMKEMTTMNVVGVDKEAQKKLKLLSKVNKKTMGSMISEIIFNYGLPSVENSSNDSAKELNKEINVLVTELREYISQFKRPWYKKLF